ncbi:MAG TPA: hypothetical protein PK857_03180 [Hyphomicrobium sp.]|nr:hypothetical protein [Hyphomicrobium sp.]HRO48576.1 hypothetical protein [Hyphomicrobium sp.]
MPFKKNPDGFSPESLGLLDVAMTRLWLQQAAVGASLSGAAPAVRASLKDKIRRLDEIGMQRRKKTENGMSAHTFKLGQVVTYHPPKGAVSRSSMYRVSKLLPIEGGELKYRIKSATDNCERVASEGQLTCERTAA